MFSESIEAILHVAYREATNRRHTHVTLEHLLYALAHSLEGEKILAACGVNLPELKQELDRFLQRAVEELPRGLHREPQETLAFRRVLQTAVLHVQSAGRQEVRAGDVLAAIMQQPKSAAAQLLEGQGVTRLDVLNYISHGITKVPLAHAGEASATDPAEAVEGDGSELAPGQQPLATFTVNLTERARAGALDPLIGRTRELQRTLEVLCRRRKNNPVFVGDAGVGKTALAEGLALRLLSPDVPKPLEGAEIFALDSTALLAGTRFRGDFEERFKAVINALHERPLAILFIDEIHTAVGAGATVGGTMDLAALIKPVLTAGELRVIGSTTFEEFKHIEKDRALARRLQKIVVEEPSPEEAIEILKGLRSRYEAHHHVTYPDATLEAAVRLAGRHLRDVRLPDSAIDILDEAGAMFRLSACGPREARVPEPPSASRRGWGPAGSENAGVESDAAAPEAQEPPVRPVEPHDVEQVVARMANIPAQQASANDRERLRTLEPSLARVVFGQEEAVRAAATAIKRSRAGLGHPDRPAGAFLFTGPTGVGKTELARQLARHLGNEFIRYDMSEYMEKHAVARLIGAPPGYVGFEQGGLLVDAVRAHPYSIVLLDEIEKAHPDVFNILLQVMDHATLTDNTGRKADFHHVVLIMTSNAGSREMSAGTIGFAGEPSKTAKARSKQALERLFSPEFRNRLDAIITFHSLTPEVMETIVDKFILELEAQLTERHVAITLTPDARAWLARKGYDPMFGARPLGRVIQVHVRDPLTDEILFGALEHGGTAVVGVEGDELTFGFQSTQPIEEFKN